MNFFFHNVWQKNKLFWKIIEIRNSRPLVFYKKGVLESFAIFIGKHLCQSFLPRKLQTGTCPLKNDKYQQMPDHHSSPYDKDMWILKRLNTTSNKWHFLQKNFENFMAPFYGWGSTASRLQPLRGGSLLFTTKFPEIRSPHFIYLGKMKGWVDL